MIQAVCQALVIWEENEDCHFEHMPWSSDTAWISAGFPQFWETKQEPLLARGRWAFVPQL